MIINGRVSGCWWRNDIYLADYVNLVKFDLVDVIDVIRLLQTDNLYETIKMAL